MSAAYKAMLLISLFLVAPEGGGAISTRALYIDFSYQIKMSVELNGEKMNLQGEGPTNTILSTEN